MIAAINWAGIVLRRPGWRLLPDNVPLDRIHAMFATLRANDEAVPVFCACRSTTNLSDTNPMMGHCVTDSAETHAARSPSGSAGIVYCPTDRVHRFAAHGCDQTVVSASTNEADKEKQTALLNGLANAFDLEQSIPATMIAAIHRAVTQRFGELILVPLEVCEDVSPVPFRLCAVYEELDTAILVVPDSIVPDCHH